MQSIQYVPLLCWLHYIFPVDKKKKKKIPKFKYEFWIKNTYGKH